METLKKLIAKGNNKDYSFAPEFDQIIYNKAIDYNGDAKEKLKGFLEDLQHGGCISGLIGEFIYHADCKEFYIKHIEDLEAFKFEIEDCLGEQVENREKIVHYTFMVWFCFEEYCYNLYNHLFD